MTYKRKLIEVALPLEAINRESARESRVGPLGHRLPCQPPTHQRLAWLAPSQFHHPHQLANISSTVSKLGLTDLQVVLEDQITGGVERAPYPG